MGRGPRPFFVQTTGDQPFKACAPAFPLPPQDNPQPATNPSIQLFSEPFGFREPEVVDLPAKNRIKRFGYEPAQIAPASRTKQLLQILPEPLHAFLRNPDFRVPVVREAVAEKASLPRPVHRALLSVYFQFEFLFDVAASALHPSLLRTAMASADSSLPIPPPHDDSSQGRQRGLPG